MIGRRWVGSGGGWRWAASREREREGRKEREKPLQWLPLLVISTKRLTLHGVMVVAKCSTTVNCSLSPWTSPLGLASQHILFSIDGIPIREFRNQESKGVLFPNNQPMRMYSTLWNADDWATRGGLVKTDWSQSPFTASYKSYNAEACVWSSGASSCSSSPSSSDGAWLTQEMDSASQGRLRWVQKNYMIYNYCTDFKRFPQGLPTECSTA
ncbi:hypothetical protein MRB53_008827 [Persea americana]|uniref:Uncharacterized protein n=1 Tax=Persea americana TaxID=3435 RepID=A0ACC2LM90_PERAE|nr:hypothetical protein MRB53_008827 [Persea americana]